MAHITSIGAGIYSALAVNTTAITNSTSADTLSELVALFADDTSFKEIKNVREFPQIGTPANIVNVPVYGSATSQQIQGQSDSPNLEITINYVPSEWDPTTVGGLGGKIGDGKQYAFQFSLLNAKPASLETNAAGLGAGANSNFYFVGKLEALLVSPQLTDANQATLTLSVQSQFFGPATVAAV
jgi:hypothetical protein